MRREGRSIEPADELEVAVSGFLAEGGDLYDAFPEGKKLRTLGKVSDVVIDHFMSRDVVEVPPRGRQKSTTTDPERRLSRK